MHVEIVWLQHFHEIQMLAGVAILLENGLGVHTYLMGKKDLATENIQNSSRQHGTIWKQPATHFAVVFGAAFGAAGTKKSFWQPVHKNTPAHSVSLERQSNRWSKTSCQWLQVMFCVLKNAAGFLKPLQIQFPFVLTFLLALVMTSIKSIFVSFNWDGLVWWLNTIVSPHVVDAFNKFYEWQV